MQQQRDRALSLEVCDSQLVEIIELPVPENKSGKTICSTAWFYIGLVMSGVFFSILIINDFFNWVATVGGQQTTLTSSHDLACKSSQLIDLTAGKLSVENRAPLSFPFATTARYADRSGSFFFR